MNMFAERLREILKEKNLSQETLARKLDTTQPTVQRWTAGKQEPSFDTLVKICLELNTDPNDLLGFDEIRLMGK